MPYFWARRNIAHSPRRRRSDFSYTFLGVRLECAQCHKHPFDQWTQDDFKQFTAFFTADPLRRRPATDRESRPGSSTEELGLDEDDQRRRASTDPRRASCRRARSGPLAGGLRRHANRPRPGVEKAERSEERRRAASSRPRCSAATRSRSAGVDDPREPLMDWLRRKDNPYFARAFVNRVWAELLRRRHHRPARRHEPGQPAEQRRPCSTTWPTGFVEPRLRHEVAAPRDRHQPDLPAELADERDEPARRAELQPRRRPPPARRGALRRGRRRRPPASTDLAKATTDVDRPRHRPQGRPAATVAAEQPSYAAKVFGRSPRDTNCDCDRVERAEPAADDLPAERPGGAGLDRHSAARGWLAETTLRTLTQGRTGRPKAKPARSRRP